jgi:biopolymer transport protein ExbB
MSGIADAFRQGGPFMWPIAVVSVFSIAVVLERVMVLYFRAGAAKEALLKAIDKLLRAGQIDRAVKLATESRSPLGRVIRAGLLAFNERKEVVQMVMDEAAVSEIPALERRTGYLAMFSNVATLTGLLGTIVGLIHSFAAVGKAEAAEKSTKLAEGISEAMNCTAFGLVVAIPALLAYAVLQSRTHRVVDEIDEAAIHVYNLIADIKDGVVRQDQAQI